MPSELTGSDTHGRAHPRLDDQVPLDDETNEVPGAEGGSEFRSAFVDLLSSLGDEGIRDYAFVDVPCDQPPWFDSGFSLECGDHVTTFAVGRTTLTGTGVWIGPSYQLWYRVGPDGEIFRGTRASHTFEASTAGRLFLASYFPGEWGTRRGDLGVPVEVYKRVRGRLSVLLLRWRSGPLEGLRRLAAIGDVGTLVADELDRHLHPIAPPPGWCYLWRLGPSEIFRSVDVAGRRHAIECRTQRDCGILLKDVGPVPLRPDTRLIWSWKVDSLPSSVPENTLLDHEYMSIAVEFDNGQDLTYFWSAELSVDTGFRCPIPSWHDRETHVVVRSGQQGLGEWHDEERDVYADYVRFVGGPAGAKIVRVWLVALTLYRGNKGVSQYADITLIADGRALPV